MSAILYGTSAPIGGTELLAAGCFTGQCTVTGAAVGMLVQVTPRTFPGNGSFWSGYVSAPDTVTIKLCNAAAGFLTASIFDVAVFNSSEDPVTHTGDLTAGEPIFGNGGGDVVAGTKRGDTTVMQCADSTAIAALTLAGFAASGDLESAGVGIPSTFKLTGETGSVPATTVFTPAVDGYFLIFGQLVFVTTDNTGTLSLNLTYTNPAGRAQNFASTLTTRVAAGTDTGINFGATACKAGVPVQIAFTAALPATTFDFFIYFQFVAAF